jgi:hypothetical protein
MARMTERDQLSSCRRAIRGWKGNKGITISVLSNRTGLSARRVEVLTRKYHLAVRRNARETTEELSQDYLKTHEVFHDFCERLCMNYRQCVKAALQTFMARRGRTAQE